MKTKPIFLMGFMASGKSKLGKKIAAKLEFPFFDLDNLIETKSGKSISQFFEENGESTFRKLESETLAEIKPKQAAVVSLGGGTPCSEENISLIKTQGFSIYLKVKPAILIGRLRKAKGNRPMIAHLNDEELSEFVNTRLIEREAFYEQADVTLDLNSQSIDELVELIESHLFNK